MCTGLPQEGEKNMESTTWRAPMRLAIATGCSAYLLIANPAVLEAGAILVSMTGFRRHAR